MIDEFLDIVNDFDIVIGRETRAIAHQLGLQHRGVHVFLFDADGRMLVQKRSADRAASPSLLDCSVSEHVQAGEGYREAAIRGMKEEMGVEGIELKRLTKFRMEYGENDHEISELYEGVVIPALVRFDPVEIEAIAYASVNELKSMLTHERDRLCGWFVELLELYLNGKGKMQVME
ncbi:MAG: NUDIX domain-containing protein [Anaerolineales bacterium]|jgi:isopentenyl-diphosphate delta-isomerase|nr:NUDIX domain-containing protein [Anaerolineales bacterium]